MIGRLGLLISRVFRYVMPDPFVLAVLLTFVTLLLARVGTGTTFPQLVDAWSSGLWGLLAFGMQMCLILVTGHALASSPPVSALLERLTRLLRTPAQAVLLVAFVAVVFGVLNWGLGLIAGALLARRVGVTMHRAGVRVHYPLLCAAGYLGLLVWHGGFSGSAPLKVTQRREIEEVFGAGAPFVDLPLTETILSPMNLLVTGGLLLLLPLVMMLLTPPARDAVAVDSFVTVDAAGADDAKGDADDAMVDADDTTVDAGAVSERRENASRTEAGLPRLLNDTPWVTALLVLLIAVWALRYYFPGDLSQSGIKSLTPNTVNLTMLGLGLILHRTPARYAHAIEDAARGCGAIILQFPLYAGIMATMKASGLTALLSARIAATTSEATLPLATLASAAVVNLFVPSGGGQWAVQGPIAMHAALDAGVDPGKIVMAVSYGDELTNMLQPFWALPLLSITGARARDIVGYTAVAMLVAATWMILGLWIF